MLSLRNIILVLILLLFNGCCSKESVFIYPDKYPFILPTEINPLTVNYVDSSKQEVIIKADVYKTYIQLLRDNNWSMREQILDYLKESKNGE